MFAAKTPLTVFVQRDRVPSACRRIQASSANLRKIASGCCDWVYVNVDSRRLRIPRGADTPAARPGRERGSVLADARVACRGRACSHAELLTNGGALRCYGSSVSAQSDVVCAMGRCVKCGRCGRNLCVSPAGQVVRFPLAGVVPHVGTDCARRDAARAAIPLILAPGPVPVVPSPMAGSAGIQRRLLLVVE